MCASSSRAGAAVADARRITAGVVVVGYLLVQLVLGVRGLVRPDVDRFGWEMFGVHRPVPEVEVVIDGRRQPIDPFRHLVTLRADLPIGRELPPHLCDLYGAEWVILTTGGHEERLRCP